MTRAGNPASRACGTGWRLDGKASIVATFAAICLLLVGENAQAVPSSPPAGRAYEMVSPLDKNGAEIDRDLPSGAFSTSGAAADGSAVAYAARGQFADIQGGALQGQYVSARGQSGWATRGINPPIAQDPSNEATAPQMWLFSTDMRRAIVQTRPQLTPNAGLLGGSWGLYMQDNSNLSSLAYELVSVPSEQLAPDTDPQSAPNRFSVAAATSDLRHVVFEGADRKLTPDALETGQVVYEWVQGQGVRLVSILPSGALPTRAVVGWAASNRGADYPGDHPVSEDGQRVFFTDRDSDALYVREGGSRTRLISGSSFTGGLPREATFEAAEAQTGSKVLFRSVVRFTGDSTACNFSCPNGISRDLYMWDANAPEGSELTDLTTADPDGGGVLGVVGAADDMSRAFFVASGVLAPGGEGGRPNLYEWSEADGVRLVARLAPFTTPGDDASSPDGRVWSWQRDAPTNRYRDARLSDDGTRLLFVSRESLAGIDTGGHPQVYLYDATTRELECVSCGEGAVVAGESWLFYPPAAQLTSRAPFRLPRNLSVDGRRVFFETARRLVGGDTNGKADVYMWSDADRDLDGELSLISTGVSSEGSQFVDASESGDDVFFTTREQLVGTDTDELVDIYDARVGGGFPEQPSPEPCVGDRCQPEASPRPGLVAPGSTRVDGTGASNRRRRATFTIGGLSAGSRVALARGRRASLVVRVSGPGRVAVRGAARAGGKRRTVLAASKRTRRAGRVVLKLRLSKAGRRQLARSGRLRVRLSVRFSGVGAPKVRSLALQAASRKGRGTR